jgi:tetratricopeptide (TPR) repeat protein
LSEIAASGRGLVSLTHLTDLGNVAWSNFTLPDGLATDAMRNALMLLLMGSATCQLLAMDTSVSTHQAAPIGVVFRSAVVTLALIIIAFVQQLPADAQTGMYEEFCANEGAIYSSDFSVEACTSLIKTANKTPHELAVLFGYRCSGFLDEGQIERALQDCDEAVQLDRKNPLVYQIRGLTFEQSHQYRRAVADYVQVISLQPSNPRAWEALCRSQLSLGQDRLAISACNEALRLRAADRETLANSGHAYPRPGAVDSYGHPNNRK